MVSLHNRTQQAWRSHKQCSANESNGVDDNTTMKETDVNQSTSTVTVNGWNVLEQSSDHTAIILTHHVDQCIEPEQREPLDNVEYELTEAPTKSYLSFENKYRLCFTSDLSDSSGEEQDSLDNQDIIPTDFILNNSKLKFSEDYNEFGKHEVTELGSVSESQPLREDNAVLELAHSSLVKSNRQEWYSGTVTAVHSSSPMHEMTVHELKGQVNLLSSNIKGTKNHCNYSITVTYIILFYVYSYLYRVDLTTNHEGRVVN